MSDPLSNPYGDLPDPATMTREQVSEYTTKFLNEMGWVRQEATAASDPSPVVAGPLMALFALVVAVGGLFLWPLGAPAGVWALADLLRPDGPRRKYWLINVTTLTIAWWELILFAVATCKYGQYTPFG